MNIGHYSFKANR